MADCCLIKKVATVEVYENKNEVRAYGFMAGDRNTPVMEVRFKHLWGESNLSTCKLRWIIVDDVGSLLVGEVPIQSDNTALINLPNELFTGDRRMKVQLTVASCDGERILNLQQFTDLKVINSLAPNEVVEPVYQILINTIYDESQKYLKELETSYTQKYGSLDSLYKNARASLEQYLITAENGGNAEFLQGYSPAHFQKVENTINDLIASTKYDVGDVVEVLGYYSAGDGAGHSRQKKATGYNGSDAVIGADGSIWGIVHSGEVNVSWFGAKGDGVTDDTEVIQKALDYNSNYKRLVFGNKISNSSSRYAIKKLTIDGFVYKEIDFCNSHIQGISLEDTKCCIEVLGFQQSKMSNLHLSDGTDTFYENGMFIISVRDGHKVVYGSVFENIYIRHFQNGLKIGERNDYFLVSETFFRNVKVISHKTPLLVGGSENVLQFEGCYFSKDTKGEEPIIFIEGSSVKISNSYVLQTGTGEGYTGVIKIEEGLSSSGTGYVLGQISLVDTFTEFGRPILNINPTSSAVVTSNSVINIINCVGYITTPVTANFIGTSEHFSGVLRIKENNFYTPTKRTAKTLNVSPNALVDIDWTSFNRNFIVGKLGIIGGILKEDNCYLSNITLLTPITSNSTLNFNTSIKENRYSSMLSQNKITAKYGVENIKIQGFLATTSEGYNINIRKNNEDFAFITKGNFNIDIPVLDGDEVSFYSYSAFELSNNLMQVFISNKLKRGV